jgi:hypothetical protein
MIERGTIYIESIHVKAKLIQTIIDEYHLLSLKAQF